MTRPDDDAPKTTALHDALRADTPDELDTQIGLGALERYDDAIRTVKVDESESIIGWWRRQPEDVVEALLDAMRRRDESAVEIIEEETETSGVELLGALIRDDDVHGGKWIYEEVVRDHLNAVRAANAADEDGETPSVRAALTGLSNDDTSSTVGATAVANDTAHLERAAYAGARSIVAEWEHRAWGPRAIAELVAALRRSNEDDVARATRGSTGGASADLVENLRDETTRAHYARLVTQIASTTTTS